MTPDDDLDVDALDRRFEAALARSRELPRELSADELTTLALPPFWTEPALNQVFGQSGETEAMIEKAGPFLHVEGDAGRRSIWVRDPNAPTLVANLRSHRALDRWAAIGSQIAGVEGLPPVLSAWADLTRQLGKRSDYDLSRELLARVAAACDAGRPGDVHDLVDGAAALARGLGPPLSGAVRVAQHRIRRWYAVQRDRRKLAYFVPRHSALAALDRLLEDRDPAALWALHVVGAAGMGKTSLIRHLATEIAAQRGLQVARIDFDHLSPAYPAHEPGQLIASLAYELTALIETESQDKLIGFVESALDQLRDLAGRGAADLRTLLDSREMQELMAWFGSLLQSFARPVLVLDTCEELTKLEVGRGALPSVEATFMMLERLHAQAPRLRVVLAGRRLLAGGYANWTASEDAARQAGVTASRPFLVLHELRGFDAAEARSYLDKRLPPARRADEPLIAKLLALSPEPSRVSALAAAPDPEPHYNPFDLTRHAEWVEADPDVPLAAFDATDIDPYVEVRIVQRMGELEPLLPAIALLRRFDLPMLAPALPANADPQAIFDQLARHEWLRTSHLRGRTVLEVDRGLPARIERCIAARRGIELMRARTVLGSDLRRVVETGSLMAISVEVYDAALRILPPDDAARLWRAIEARIGAEADWKWCAELATDLIADGRAGELAGEHGAQIEHPAGDHRAVRRNELVGLSIRATYASAIVHVGAGADLAALWREIERRTASVEERAAASNASAARRGPGGVSPAWLLRQRARLGGVAASAAAATAADQVALVATIAEIASELAQGGEPDALASSRCAAIEAVIELAERDPEHAAPELTQLMDQLAFDQPALTAFAVMLRARIEALVSRARSIPALPDPVPALAATVLDWRPPDSLSDRLRLEIVRWFELLDLSADPALRAALHDAAPTWRAWAEGASATIDGDRLRSAAITVLGSAAQTAAAVAIDAAAEPRCAAHRQYPPLAFAHGRVALARGKLSEARAIARQLPRPWAQRLSCEIARWTRLPDDLTEEIFIDGLDPETTAAIDAARAIVKGVVAMAPRPSPAAPVAHASNTDVDLARLHPSLRGEALRMRLRERALDGGDLAPASSEREVMTAIEEAELLDRSRPDAAIRLFDWASDAAARLELAPARLRAMFGAWLAARRAPDPRINDFAAPTLHERLAETPDELIEYRQALERAHTIALSTTPLGRSSDGPSARTTPMSAPDGLDLRGAVTKESLGQDAIGSAPGEPDVPIAMPIGPVAPTGHIKTQSTTHAVTPDDMGSAPDSTPRLRRTLVAGIGVAGGGGALFTLFDHLGAWGIGAGVLIVGLLVLVQSWRMWSAKSAGTRMLVVSRGTTVIEAKPIDPRVLQDLARALKPTQPRKEAPASSPLPERYPIISVTRLLPAVAEIAIATGPEAGQAARSTASISSPGQWPELIGRGLEPALVALADAAGRGSIALAPIPELAPRCWEGTLHSLVPQAVARLAFHRVLPVGPARSDDPRPALIEADGTLASSLARAWNGQPGIVHVVRRLSRTRRGDIGLTVNYGRDVPTPNEPETVLELAGARLLIMQCDPSTAESSTWANTSEPELAREYVVGALRRGSACGLVIPAVPAQLLEELTARLVAGVGGCSPGELIDTARLLRAYLREHGGAASEVTLFLRDGQPE